MDTLNEICVDGIEYIAVPETSTGGCDGCEGNKDYAVCLRLPFCTAALRNDGRNVIWIKKSEEK